MTLKRVRGDAILERLSKEQQKQLVAWLEDEHLTYVKVAAKVKETFGVEVGRSTVGCYWQKHILPRRLVQETSSPEEAAELPQDKVDAAIIKIGSRQALVLLDQGTAAEQGRAIKLMRMVHAAKRDTRAAERHTRIEREKAEAAAAAAARAAEEKAKAEAEKPKKRTPEEKDRDLRALWGISETWPKPPLLPNSTEHPTEDWAAIEWAEDNGKGHPAMDEISLAAANARSDAEPDKVTKIMAAAFKKPRPIPIEELDIDDGPMPMPPPKPEPVAAPKPLTKPPLGPDGKPQKRKPHEVPEDECPHPDTLDYTGCRNPNDYNYAYYSTWIKYETKLRADAAAAEAAAAAATLAKAAAQGGAAA